jgi:hypothetical protein
MGGDPHIYDIQNAKYSYAITMTTIIKNAEIICNHTMVLVTGTYFLMLMILII